MASTMTNVFVLLFVVVVILLLSTAFDRLLTILLTRPSTQEGQKFLTAIEDLVLPMGSFPSRLLNPWSSTPKSYNSSSLPPTSNSESKQEAVPALDAPTHIHNRTKDIPILSFTQLTTIEIEPSADATSPAVNDLLAEFHVFENEIRGLIDPEGIHSSQSASTRDIVADMITNHAEAVNGLRHDWAKEREEFERNAQEHETNYHELERENNILSRQKERKKEKSRQLKSQNKCLRAQIEEKIQIKDDAEKRAATAEQVANAGVQRRIDEVQIDLRQKNKVAEDKLKQERDSAILAKREVETELVEARSEVSVLALQQKTAAKENTTILNEYKECLEQRNLEVKTSKKLAELAERNLEAFKNKKLIEESDEVNNLQKQLRESKDLAKSLEPCKTKAENYERMCQRLRENSTNEADEVREVKDHKINRLESEISGHRKIMAADEATISRQAGEIARLESGEALQKLQSKLEQAKKQLKDAELETKNLRRDLRTGAAKSKQDAENALMEARNQHEKDKGIAVDNAIQQAKMTAAVEAKKKEQQYAVDMEAAVEHAKKNAALEAAQKEQQYAAAMEAAVEQAKRNAAVEAATKERQYAAAMEAAVEQAIRKTVREMESKAAAENAAAEVEKQAARETQMDITPDPELDAELMAEVDDALKKEQQHQNEIDEAVKVAVEKALENAKQLHQQQMAAAVQYAVQDAKINHEKEKNDLVAAKEAAEIAQQAQEVPDKVIQTNSSDLADGQTSNNPIDLTLAATEADEASKLLGEVVKNGIAMDTVEHTVLCRLYDIRVALHNVKATLQTPSAPTETSHYKDLLRIFRLEEAVLERLDRETNHKLLARQGRLANERLRQVSNILESSVVQKDAILQALVGPRRDIAPMRGLKRSTPSKKPKVDNGQPSADVPPTPSAKPKAANHQSFASILESLRNS